MSFLSTLRQWDQAVACVDQGDVETALRTFLDISEKNSKISFNIGCLHLAKEDFEAAEKVGSSFSSQNTSLWVACQQLFFVLL